MSDQVQEPVEVLAVVVRVEDLESPEGESPVLTVITWGGNEPIPFLDYGDASDAVDLTTQFLAAIDANPEFVPEGWERDEVDFAYSALIDGMEAVRDELPRLADIDEALDTIGGVMEGFMLEGLFVPQPREEVTEDAELVD